MTPARRRRRSPEVTRPSVFWPLAVVVLSLFSVLARMRFVGRDKLPVEGPFVLAPNHHSEFDPVVVAVAVWRMGRAPRFLAKESLFTAPVVGWVLRATKMIPVSRHSSHAASQQTLKAAEQLVANGQGVIVYPEGSLTRDPELWPMRGKSGAVRLALQADAPLIPMAQWGAQQIMPRYGKFRLFPPRRPVTIAVGDPIDLSDLAGRAHESAALTEGTNRLMQAITALLEELRAEHAPAERWDPAKHRQSEAGRIEKDDRDA